MGGLPAVLNGGTGLVLDKVNIADPELTTCGVDIKGDFISQFCEGSGSSFCPSTSCKRSKRVGNVSFNTSGSQVGSQVTCASSFKVSLLCLFIIKVSLARATPVVILVDFLSRPHGVAASLLEAYPGGRLSCRPHRCFACH